jgi:hypothetical protein
MVETNVFEKGGRMAAQSFLLESRPEECVGNGWSLAPQIISHEGLLMRELTVYGGFDSLAVTSNLLSERRGF